MFAFWSLIAGALQGAATGCHCTVLVFEGCLGLGAFLMVPLQGAAARCLCLSAVCALELGCWCRCRVPQKGVMQGVSVLCALSGLGAAPTAGSCCAAAGCCCKELLSEWCLRSGAWFPVPVPLQGAAVRMLFAFSSFVAGAAPAATKCCCQSCVLLGLGAGAAAQFCCAAAGCCCSCQSTVRALFQ